MPLNKLAALSKEPTFKQTLGYYWLIVCMGLNMAIIGPTLPALAAQTHALLGNLGQLFLSGAIGSTLGTLLGGRLLERLRGHTLLGGAQMSNTLGGD